MRRQSVIYLEKVQKNKQIIGDLMTMTFVGRKKEFECFFE